MPQDSAPRPFVGHDLKPLSPPFSPKAGTYGAEGDPWVYTVDDSGAIQVSRDGKVIPVRPGSFAHDAIMEQMSGGTLKSTGSVVAGGAPGPGPVPQGAMATPIMAGPMAGGPPGAAPAGASATPVPPAPAPSFGEALGKYAIHNDAGPLVDYIGSAIGRGAATIKRLREAVSGVNDTLTQYNKTVAGGGSIK
jgi:hypothetical protein